MPSPTAAAPNVSSPRGAFAALQFPDFRLFWMGLTVSVVGTSMHMTAMNWLVWRLSESPQVLGLVGFAQNVCILPLGFFAGTLIDRYDRRRLVLGAQLAAMVMAFATAGLAWSGEVRVWHLAAIGFLMGTVSMVEIPARQTFLMDLVGRRYLMSAIALNATAFNVSRIVGPALAGLLVAVISEAGCFFLNGLSFLGLIAAMVLIRVPRPPGPPAAGAAGVPGALAGLRFILAARDLRLLLAMLATGQLFAMPYHQLLPAFVGGELGGDARTLGYCIAAFSVGSVSGVLAAARRDPSGLTPRHAGFGFLGVSATLIGFATLADARTALPWLVFFGFFFGTQMATTNNYLQSRAPDHLRGRIVAAYTTTVMGFFPFGCLILGTLAERVGYRNALALGGFVCLVVALGLLPGLPTEPPPTGE